MLARSNSIGKKISVATILLAITAWLALTVWPVSERGPQSRAPAASPGFVKEGQVTFLDSIGTAIIRIDVEIASRPEERNQGLMYRKNMPNDFGMLFIFEQEAPRSFWMRNTPIPLDVLFLDQHKRIVSIQTDTKPFSDDPIPSTGPAMYVIEVNAGFTNKYKIQPGQTVLF